MHSMIYSLIVKLILVKLSAIIHPQNIKFSHLNRIQDACKPKHLENIW